FCSPSSSCAIPKSPHPPDFVTS
ncbi:polysulfide reductase, NrfD family protein, partial [Vibrio parahaemolyticus V-223/04]